MPGRVAAGAAALALGLPSAALAQRTYGDDPAFDAALGVLGAVTRGFHIEAQLRTTYDTNLPQRNTTPGAPVERGDFRLAPAVSAGVAYPLGRQNLTLDAQLGRDYYISNSLRNRNRYAFTGGLGWRLGNRCSGNLNADYRRRQNILSDLAFQTDNVQVSQNYGASANCTIGGKFGIGGGVTHSQTDNKSALRQAFDSRTTSYSANVNYGSATLGSLSLGGSFGKSDYPQRFQPVGVDPVSGLIVLSNEADSVKVFRGTIGYSRSFGTRINVSVSGSYLNAKPKPVTVLTPQIDPATGLPFIDPITGGPILILQDRTGFKGGGYNAALSYRPTPRLSADVSISKQVSSSTSVGALFVVSQRYGVDLGYTLGPSITTGIGATFSKREYRNSFASGVEPVARRNDDTSRYYVRAGYAPSRLYDVDVEVGHQRRKSTPALYTSNSTTATVTLRVRFGRG